MRKVSAIDLLDLPITPVRSPDVQFHPIDPPLVKKSDNLYFIPKPWLILKRTKRKPDQDQFFCILETARVIVHDVITVAKCEAEEDARLITLLLNEDFYRKQKTEFLG